MRRVLPGDVSTVARILVGLPESIRPFRLARLIAAAEIADRFRGHTGRAHPRWGTGSLAAAGSGMPRSSEPDFDDDDYCRCWIMVLEALIRHRSRMRARRRRAQPAAQEIQSGVVGSSSSRFTGMSSPQSRHSP